MFCLSLIIGSLNQPMIDLQLVQKHFAKPTDDQCTECNVLMLSQFFSYIAVTFDTLPARVIFAVELVVSCVISVFCDTDVGAKCGNSMQNFTLYKRQPPSADVYA